MGLEMLEGLRVSPKTAAPIIQENQQTDHCPSRYILGRRWIGKMDRKDTAKKVDDST